METIINLLKMLFSGGFFLHFGPACFLADNLIVCYYLYGIKRYETKEAARKGKKYFWKQLAWKSAYFLFLLFMILEGTSEAVYGSMLFIAVMYYVYVLVVVIVFLVYLARKLSSYFRSDSSAQKHLDN